MKYCGEGIFCKTILFMASYPSPLSIHGCLARRSVSAVLMHVVVAVEGGARDFIV